MCKAMCKAEMSWADYDLGSGCGREPRPADPIETDIETDIETAVASIQSGRVRFAALIRRGLAF